MKMEIITNLSSKIFETERRIKKIFSSYQLNEIRTPALEDTNLFKRSAAMFQILLTKKFILLMIEMIRALHLDQKEQRA